MQKKFVVKFLNLGGKITDLLAGTAARNGIGTVMGNYVFPDDLSNKGHF